MLVFPWSMSDFKPGERIFDVMVKDQKRSLRKLRPDGNYGRLYLPYSDAFVDLTRIN